MSEFINVGTKTDFPENQTKGVKIGEVDVCIANWKDNLTAFDNSCTHAHALLSDCDIEDSEVACPLHGARFNVQNGQAMTPPAVRPVRMHEVKVEGNDVLVKLSDVPVE